MQKLKYQVKNKIYNFDLTKGKISVGKENNKFSFSVGIIIDTALSIPPYTGVTYRLYYLSRKLSSLGVEVKIFCCNRNIKKDSDINKLINKDNLEIHIIPESIFYNINKLEKIIEKTKIDILQVEDPVSVLRYKPIADKLKIPMCLEMHDVEPTLLKYFGKSDGEIDLSTAISGLACQLSDLIVCTVSSDRQSLIKEIIVDQNKLKIVPNPVDFSQFKFFGPNTKQKNIIFIGNMFYGPNRSAVEAILDKIYYKLIKLHPDVTFTFVGMTPDDLVKKYKDKKQVFFTGIINDLNSVFSKATIALCPVTSGSGMKVKILNYCAAGLPIITTTIGASGYERIDSLLIEDDLDNYVATLDRLLKQPKQIKKIGKLNHDVAKKYYDINIIARQIISYYRELIIVNRNLDLKKLEKIINLPLPMWLEEKRAARLRNNNYYIVNNDKVRVKKIKT